MFRPLSFLKLPLVKTQILASDTIDTEIEKTDIRSPGKVFRLSGRIIRIKT